MTARALMFLLAAALGSPALADERIANGKALIKSWGCTQCHGLTGNDRSAQEFPVPMLAGQPADFLVRRLKQYKTVDIDDPVWRRKTRLTQGLSERDMADIAAYYEAQKRY